MEEKILDLFLYNHKLKFNEIEKYIKIRSNKLAYHLKNLIKKGILTKNQDYYELSETSEHVIPYLSKKQHALPVLLIHIGNKTQSFLFKREKRPFKDKLSLPGGRLLIGESIDQATKRIMKEKFSIEVEFKKINSVSLEHVKRKNIIHSFILIFVSAKSKQKIPLTEIRKNKSKIIPSDYQLLNQDLNKKINIKTLFTPA